MKKNITDIYFLEMLGVDAASIYIGDLKEGFKDPMMLFLDGGNFDEIEKQVIKENKKKNSLCMCNDSDGGYSFFVGVNKFNEVIKIFAESNVSEFGGVSKFKIHNSYGQEKIDMNDQFFIKKKKEGIKRIKTINLKISSDFILLDDGDPNSSDPEIQKGINEEFQEKYYSKKYIPIDYDQVFPVKNGTYPVYLHCYKSKETIGGEDITLKYVKIVVENIEGCYLNKDEEGKLIFQRNHSSSLSLNNFINKKSKEAFVDKIDLRDSQSLKEIEKLENVEILTLYGINNIKDCSSLYKLKKLKTLHLVDCYALNLLNLKKNNKFEVKIKKLTESTAVPFLESFL